MAGSISRSSQSESNKQGVFLALLGVIFVASNLRAPLTSVGPVIDQISTALSLSNASAGMLTTIPLLAFGILSGGIPRFSKRWGMEIVLLFSLLLLAFGLLVRSAASISSLFLGSILIGTAITVGNVLMPAYIKKMFPKRVGMVMGIYAGAMNLTAALAAGFSISLGKLTHLGWQGAIGVWVVLTAVALLIWLPQVKKGRSIKENSSTASSESAPKVNLFKSRTAWAVTFFMGIQSLLFYVMSAWLPKMAQDWGMSTAHSGWVLSYLQFAQLPMTFLGAIIATKMKNQRLLGVIVGALFSLGFLGLILFKAQFIVLSCILIGVGSGLAFSIAMIFFVLRTAHTAHATKLSGMAQSIGYLVAATGPPIVGGLYDNFGSWTPGLIFLFVGSVLLVYFGWVAGKNTTIS